MSTRQLLELAAKAGGFPIPIGCEFTEPAYWHNLAENEHIVWNPLHDGNDALGLAANLRIAITFPEGENTVRCWFGALNSEPVVVPIGNDVHAAVRLAIVLSAAEIGKTLP